jgi:hypothetical protein
MQIDSVWIYPQHQMATVRITLTEYDVCWDLSREGIRTKIPESLLGQALQEEPDAPEIVLRHPDVIPEAIRVIADYLEGKEVWHEVKDVDPSGRYLNLSKVLYYDSLYNEVETLFAENWDTETNREVLLKAIRQQKNHVMLYLRSKGVSATDGLTVAIQSNNLGAFKHFVYRGRD